MPGLKVSISRVPQYAPSNYDSLPYTMNNVLDDWDESKSYGSGIPSNLKCESCGHGGDDLEEGVKNKLIYYYSLMQRNGNYSTRKEILCGACGVFSTIETWEEG